MLSTCEQDLALKVGLARAKRVLDEEIISRICAWLEYCKDIYHAITRDSKNHP